MRGALVTLVLLLAFAWLLVGCASSLPLRGTPECDETYHQPVWTGTRWVECV